MVQLLLKYLGMSHVGVLSVQTFFLFFFKKYFKQLTDRFTFGLKIL